MLVAELNEATNAINYRRERTQIEDSMPLQVGQPMRWPFVAYRVEYTPANLKDETVSKVPYLT